VFVTHDQEEALEVSDNIVILNKGKIEQIGAPEEVYDHPANPFVYSFLGNVNLFHARLDQGVLNLAQAEDPADRKGELSFFVPPQDVVISLSDEGGKAVEAEILSHRVLGSRVRVNLKTIAGEKEIEADIDKKQWTLITKANRKRVYILFFGAKIYSKDETWSDYVL
jgi:sulfate transport system ATP-binding protein